MTGIVVIALDNIKSEVNLGAVLRGASAYGASMVAYSGKRLQVANCSTDTCRAFSRLPVLHTLADLHTLIPYGCVPVAVEIVEGAVPLYSYVHPVNAFYVFGAEDNTLGQRVLSWCRDKVYIPTTHCLNLAAAVNIVLYDRKAKEAAIEKGKPNEKTEALENCAPASC
jgi:tRNA(Leu) C34 or U34 (ribose-2'-O)-methylase TrmL